MLQPFNFIVQIAHIVQISLQVSAGHTTGSAKQRNVEVHGIWRRQRVEGRRVRSWLVESWVEVILEYSRIYWSQWCRYRLHHQRSLMSSLEMPLSPAMTAAPFRMEWPENPAVRMPVWRSNSSILNQKELLGEQLSMGAGKGWLERGIWIIIKQLRGCCDWA